MRNEILTTGRIMEQINILVVDADDMEREKISGILSRNCSIASVTQASSYKRIMNILNMFTPNIAFVDIGCLPLSYQKSTCPLHAASVPIVYLMDDGEMDIPEIAEIFGSFHFVEKSRLSDQIDEILALYLESTQETDRQTSAQRIPIR